MKKLIVNNNSKWGIEIFKKLYISVLITENLSCYGKQLSIKDTQRNLCSLYNTYDSNPTELSFE